MKIITDSTADLTKELYQKYDITPVPLSVHLEDKTWRDFYDIDLAEYYSLLGSASGVPSTSQPSPQDFVNVFAPYVERGEPILSIHISSRLSGTYQSATLARSHFPDARIEVVDSRQASLGLGQIILLLAEEAGKGVSFDDTIERSRDLIRRTETYFSVDSLKYLQRGGRIGKAQAFVGTLMKIKPLLRLVDGEIQPVEKIRTTENLLGRFVELLEKEAAEASAVQYSLAESDNGGLVTDLVKRLEKIENAVMVYRAKIGGVVSSHAGPGTLGITFVKDSRR
jgi:DegV family protein with EDD domain